MKKTDPLYISILFLLLFYRCLVMVLFNFKYTDGDQTLMWQAVVDFSRGTFHEPRFWGQNYNSMIEALFAVPLYLLGVPPYKALPVVTNIMAIFPYILISLVAHRQGRNIESYAVLGLSLFLAPEYDLITSMPRGFVTGIFFASAGSIAIFYPDKKWGYFFLGLFGVIGYSINPNSILVTIPAMLYLSTLRYRDPEFYIFSGLGMVPAAILHFLANYFYIVHPAYNLHQPADFKYSFDTFISSFSNLDEHFNHLTPFFWKMGWGVLLFLAILAGIFINRKLYRQAFVLIFSLVFIIMTLGVQRIYTATTSIFFSYSRMYLAIPVLIALFIPFLPYRTNWLKYFFLVLAAGFVLKKSVSLPEKIRLETLYDIHTVNVTTIEELQKECLIRQIWINRFKVDIVIDEWNRFYTLTSYGCPVCEPGFPKTLYAPYERRTWRLLEDQYTVYKNIMLVDQTPDAGSIVKKCNAMKIPVVRYGSYFFIQNNTIPTILLLRSLNVELRKF